MFEKCKEYIDGLLESLRKSYAGLTPDSREANEVLKMTDAIEELHRLWEEAALSARENYLSGGKQKNTTIDGDVKFKLREYSQHQKDNWKSSKRIVIYESETQFRDFINEALQNKQFDKKLYFGAIPTDLAALIKSKTGLNVEGFNCSLSAYEIRKIFDDHGDETKETLRGQRAITEDDIVNIPLVLQSPETIVRSEKDYMGKPVINMTKHINGKMTISAVVSDKHLDLFVQTAYVGIKKGNLFTPIAEQAAIHTPKASSDTVSNDSISNSSKNVKGNTVGNEEDFFAEDNIKRSIREDFYNEFDSWDKKNPSVTFTIGNTSDALQSIGVKQQEIKMRSGMILNKINKHPEISVNTFREIPRLLEEPIIVQFSDAINPKTGKPKYDSRITVLGELYADMVIDGKTEQKPVLVSIELLPTNQKATTILDISIITSAYVKNKLQSYINENSILYIEPNKKRTNRWLSLNRLQLPVGETRYGSIRKITYADEKVKIENSKNETPMQKALRNAGVIDSYGNIISKEQEFDTEFSDKKSDRDYSYDELISKPDMKITMVNDKVVYKPSSTTRKSIVNQAIKNATSIGKTNENGNVVIRVDDIETDVVVSKSSLAHGLDRRLQVSAPVILNIGSVLKNSVRINELTPKTQSAKESYVLIGYAESADNAYIVRMVVNNYTNEMDSVDVLYAVNTKKETVGIKPGSHGKTTLPTVSTISISNLLEYVNRFFPDVFPEDVLKHYGHQSRPQGDLGGSALFQDRVSIDMSPRGLLAGALESSIDAKTPSGQIQLKKLREYKEHIEELNELSKTLSEQRKEIHSILSVKGGRTAEIQKRLVYLQGEVVKNNNRVNTLDKKLLNLEVTAPLKAVLETEKKEAAKRQKAKNNPTSLWEVGLFLSSKYVISFGINTNENGKIF